MVKAPKDWKRSSFLRYVNRGIYSLDWGTDEDIKFSDNIGRE
nr:hypothetical protein [Baaleninema simplex]